MEQMRRLGKRGGVVPKHLQWSLILGSSCREKNPPFITTWLPSSFGPPILEPIRLSQPVYFKKAKVAPKRVKNGGLLFLRLKMRKHVKTYSKMKSILTLINIKVGLITH